LQIDLGNRILREYLTLQIIGAGGYSKPNHSLIGLVWR